MFEAGFLFGNRYLVMDAFGECISAEVQQFQIGE